MNGVYKYEIIRKGKVIARGRLKNQITLEGRNHMLNTEFRGGTQQTSWFFGLVDNSGWTGNPETDTMASHPGWVEFAGYSEATRRQWSPGVPVAGSLANSTPAVFTITGSGAIYGFFISSNSTKGGTSGTLWSSVQFASGVQSVNAGDEIRVTYTYGIVG